MFPNFNIFAAKERYIVRSHKQAPKMTSKVNDLHNPSFILLPTNNNRTAWRPISLPVVLVVPNRIDPVGSYIPNSEVNNIRISIENVPQEAKVAGHNNVGIRWPDRELYAETISGSEFSDKLIDISQLTFTRNGNEIEYSEAITGDLFSYTTLSGVNDTITYVKSAEYYDLSTVAIDVEHLPPDNYNLVYSGNYFRRVITVDGKIEFLCIDTTIQSLAIFKFIIQHPGAVIEEFYRHTPVPYLTNAAKSADTTIDLYRPFTDALQDVMDEQDLLEKINWVYETSPEAIPYLSSLLGWDIPYFPESLDSLRRAVLRRTSEFQQLKGSRRAIINIFKLFGFEILISNLWWSTDGVKLIRPDERLPAPYQDQEIKLIKKLQVDNIIKDYNTPGYGQFQIPLLFRPQTKTGLDKFAALSDGSNLTVDIYLVANNGPAKTSLDTISNDLLNNIKNSENVITCNTDDEGYSIPSSIYDDINIHPVLGYSQVFIDGSTGKAVDQTLAGESPPLLSKGTSFDKETNILSITLNGYHDFESSTLYAFATYQRYDIQIPESIAHLQSNRFDIQLLSQDLAEFVDPTTLEFAIEFLYKLKAFHSQLNVIRSRIELTETYQVTDICIGGDSEQRYDIGMGRQQVPPAIIPNIPVDSDDCASFSPRSLGYKESDITYRLRLLTNLPEEHAAWKSLDDRTNDTINNNLNILANQPSSNRIECRFNPFGQDRVIIEDLVELASNIFSPPFMANTQITDYRKILSPTIQSSNGIQNDYLNASSNANSDAYSSFMKDSTQTQTPHCDLNVDDYCYKGRTQDEILYRQNIKAIERYNNNPCHLSYGAGIYWTYPSYVQAANSGVHKKSRNSQSSKIRYSGSGSFNGELYYKKDQPYLNIDLKQPLPIAQRSLLGSLYQSYGNPIAETIHFTNRNTEPPLDQRHQLALQRPSLEIQKTASHFPGCRFILQHALLETFTHPNIKARPWDTRYSTYCGPSNICSTAEPTFLNARIIIGTDDNEYLTFDDVEYELLGNGITPDISTYGDHSVITSFDSNDVIHSIYMKDATSNPAVTLDNICDYGSDIDDDGITEITDPLFKSYNDCGSRLIDYADGYPCDRGIKDGFPDQNLDRDGLYNEILNGLGLTYGEITDESYLFTYGSGIRATDITAYRYDCGCTLAGCDPTDQNMSTLCPTSLYVDEDGYHDWNPDHLIVTNRIVLNENVNNSNNYYNGQIPSFFELVSN